MSRFDGPGLSRAREGGNRAQMDALSAMLAALNAPVAKAAAAAATAAAPVLKSAPPAGLPVLGEAMRATIHPVTKVLDAKKGLVQYLASDESIDSYREVVCAAGWQFDRFKKNAPFVDSHDYGTVRNLLGMVTDYTVDTKKGQLVETVQWAIDVETNDLARFGFQMTEAGYLKAVSVGFAPTKYASRWSDEKDWQDAVAQVGMSAANAAICQIIYLSQQQLELSACILGANGNAVAKAFAGGALSDEDLDKLADIAEAADKQISRAVVRSTGVSSVNPADDETTLVRQERSAFLRELQELTNR